MARDERPPARKPRSRTAIQRAARKEHRLARVAERRALEEVGLIRRYEELGTSMARIGIRIGNISDLDDAQSDPEKRFSILKARVERWEALWHVTLRKRTTRGKIMIGGAVLAELEALVMEDPNDQAFLARVTAILDRRVPRIQDRVIIRSLLGQQSDVVGSLTLRRAGPADETIEQALAARGEEPALLETNDCEGDDRLDLDGAGDRLCH
jgi:hypothetical protein